MIVEWGYPVRPFQLGTQVNSAHSVSFINFNEDRRTEIPFSIGIPGCKKLLGGVYDARSLFHPTGQSYPHISLSLISSFNLLTHGSDWLIFLMTLKTLPTDISACADQGFLLSCISIALCNNYCRHKTETEIHYSHILLLYCYACAFPYNSLDAIGSYFLDEPRKTHEAS